MKRFRIAPGLFCLVAALLLVTAPVAAQRVTGEIQGIITDASGSPLPGVTVTATKPGTPALRVRSSPTPPAPTTPRRFSPASTKWSRRSKACRRSVRPTSAVFTAQVQDINLQMQVESTSEVITVTAETPLVEVSRSSAANYVDEVAIDNLPINGRDFTTFATQTPTVQVDRSRGFLTMSGQRAVYTDLNVDGANNKSTFFGYGRGGEATENDGLIIAQDSVQEFKIVVNEFFP